MKANRLIDLMHWLDGQGIAADDPRRHKAYGLFLDRKAREFGVPVTGIFELTPLCNFDCGMCYVHLTKGQMEGRKVLRAPEWLARLAAGVVGGMMSAPLTGGEALLHPDFDEIYLHLRKRGVMVTVMSNGWLLTKERVAFFEKYPPASIQVTLYGGNEDDYEKVTGKRAFGCVTENILRARKVDCRLLVSATPSKYFGLEALKRVKAFALENGLKLKVNNALNEPREETGRALEDFALSEEEIVDIKLYLAGKDRECLRELSDAPPTGRNQKPSHGLRCGAGRDLFCINWKGQMKACLDLEEYQEPLAVGFDAAWERLHDFAVHYEVPRECVGCKYVQVCNPCPVLHAMNAPKGHADPVMCARTRKLARCGCLRLPEGEG